jgi:hypothetical protein
MSPPLTEHEKLAVLIMDYGTRKRQMECFSVDLRNLGFPNMSDMCDACAREIGRFVKDLQEVYDGAVRP